MLRTSFSGGFALALVVMLQTSFSCGFAVASRKAIPHIHTNAPNPTTRTQHPDTNIDKTMVESRFEVGMTGEGCSNAVQRILQTMDGVTDIDCNVETKRVVVTHEPSLAPLTVLEKLRTWSHVSGTPVALDGPA